MSWRRRRRGIFEGLPRRLYRETGARYVDALAVLIVFNGVVVAAFGVVVVALYVDLSAAELAVFAAVSAAALAVEALVAAIHVRRDASPVRRWLAGDDAALQAWPVAARLPVALLRRPDLYVLGAVGAAASDLLLAALLDRPASEAALLFPLSYLLYE